MFTYKGNSVKSFTWKGLSRVTFAHLELINCVRQTRYVHQRDIFGRNNKWDRVELVNGSLLALLMT